MATTPAIRKEIGLYDCALRAARRTRNDLRDTIDRINASGLGSADVRYRATDGLARAHDELTTAIQRLEANIRQAEDLDRQIARERRVAAGEPEYKTVTIPGCVDHAGRHSVVVELVWLCPACGGPRGEPYQTLSYDGSRRLGVHGWTNPCGHPDSYRVVRAEAGVTSCPLGAHG